MSLAAGTRIGAYEILGLIGAGGMGEVYRARDTRLARDVAIKVLPDQVAGDRDRLARFEREARTLASLTHPNILTIYAFETEAGLPYAVTELVEGESLRARLGRERLSAGEAVEIAATIAGALSAAHARGVVHRDMKPENVLLTPDGRVKVLDFGLAAIASPTTASAQTATANVITQPGTVLGTPGYMSPEQVRGEATDHRTDIFALGCITYELLAGKPAFVRRSVADTLSAILRDPAPELPVAGIYHARELQHVIARCLEKQPDRRFQSASDLAFALREHGATSAHPRGAAGEAAYIDQRPSIAVLPFANLSADPEQEYFCDGMAEEIVNALVHVDGLRVLARTSSFAFKGRQEDVREIGRRLDAGLIIEGSVRRSGDRLRITAQLVDVSDGSHLWSEKYDRRAADVFAVQDGIALAVVENLKVRVLAGERAAMARRPAMNLRAYDAYLKGLFHWNRLAPDAFATSCESFEEAIRLDPQFAPAYVFLGQAHASPAFWADAEPGLAMGKALPLVEQALALDPQCAEAHTARGILAGFFEYRWDLAEECFRTGLRLGPGLAFVHLQLMGFSLIRQRTEDAILEGRVTLRLDPLSPTTSAWAALWLASAGMYEEARQHLETIAATNPTYWMPRYAMAVLLALGGNLREARAEAEAAVTLSGAASQALAVLGVLVYLSGDTVRGDAIRDEMRQRANGRYVSPTALAFVDLARGDIEAGVADVLRASQVHDPSLPYWRLNIPRLLPSDPRIDDALRAIGV